VEREKGQGYFDLQFHEMEPKHSQKSLCLIKKKFEILTVPKTSKYRKTVPKSKKKKENLKIVMNWPTPI